MEMGNWRCANKRDRNLFDASVAGAEEKRGVPCHFRPGEGLEERVVEDVGGEFGGRHDAAEMSWGALVPWEVEMGDVVALLVGAELGKVPTADARQTATGVGREGSLELDKESLSFRAEQDELGNS